MILRKIYLLRSITQIISREVFHEIQHPKTSWLQIFDDANCSTPSDPNCHIFNQPRQILGNILAKSRISNLSWGSIFYRKSSKSSNDYAVTHPNQHVWSKLKKELDNTLHCVALSLSLVSPFTYLPTLQQGTLLHSSATSQLLGRPHQAAPSLHPIPTSDFSTPCSSPNPVAEEPE
jgi:hypothetical protein